MLASRLLMGQFSNYELVLPKESGKVLELNRGEFEDVVRSVPLLADDRVPGVRLAFEKDRLEVSTSCPEYGKAKEFVETQYGHQPVQIGFNAQYVLEFLRVVEATTTVRMQVKDAESAAEFRPAGDDAEHYRYVLMPFRL